ncbi:MAG: FAD/NAD(P)-binding protein [Acidimicrobiales bacterium]
MSALVVGRRPAAPRRAGPPMQPVAHRVVSRHDEMPDTVTLGLVPEADELAPFRPGQFNMVWVPGVGEIPISVSSAPGDPGPLLHTVRAQGAVSAALAARPMGATVGLRGPFGSDWGLADPLLDGTDLVFVAGGLGLAPLRAGLRAAIAERDRFASLSLLVGARQPDLVLFPDELDVWAAGDEVDVQVTVDHADATWSGEVGVASALVPRLAGDPARTVALVCGPEVMMRFTAAALEEWGVARHRIRLSLERNMKCAVAMCGHCQFGASFVCREGPVYPYDRVAELLRVREL